MLFHVRFRLRPPPKPGRDRSFCTMKVLPVVNVIGLPQVESLRLHLDSAGAALPPQSPVYDAMRTANVPGYSE
jgi:hypothetical protein